MLNVSSLIILLLLVQPYFSMEPDEDEERYNKDYYSSSVQGLVRLLQVEQEFMENFTIYANVLQEKVDNLNMWVLFSQKENLISYALKFSAT